MTMELHAIPVNHDQDEDIFIIYRPLLGIAFAGNQALVDLAQNVAQGKNDACGGGPVASFLQEIGFMAPDPPPPKSINGVFQPGTAVLLLTNQCQLRCTYCYAAAGEAPAEYLTVEQGKAAIDYVVKSAEAQGLPTFHLSFHGGGEPTLAWDVIKRCTAHARAKELPTRISLTSNGIWSPQQQAWIIDNIDDLTISLDGRPQTQDQQRPFVSGLGSSELVFETLRELDRHNFRYAIRLTATAPWSRLPDDVRYLCEQTNCRTMQVEPAYNLVRGGYNAGDEQASNAFAAAFMAAYEIAAAKETSLIYSGSRPSLVSDMFCRAPYDALIISPHGRLVSCYEVTADSHPLAPMSTIGQFDGQEFHIDDAARSGLHTLMNQRQANCQDCFCFRSCAGDCYTRAFAYEEGGHLHYGMRCQINRKIFKQQLLDGIANGDGVWRRPANGQQVAVLQHQPVEKEV